MCLQDWLKTIKKGYWPFLRQFKIYPTNRIDDEKVSNLIFIVKKIDRNFENTKRKATKDSFNENLVAGQLKQRAWTLERWIEVMYGGCMVLAMVVGAVRCVREKGGWETGETSYCRCVATESFV
jgi:hypothetical protein